LLGERIQPLANGHRLVYRTRTSNLDLEPAPAASSLGPVAEIGYGVRPHTASPAR